MKKQKTKNLSKAQLKKLKGGLIVCNNTGCLNRTCDGQRSEDYCTATDNRTLNISGGGSNPTPKAKK